MRKLGMDELNRLSVNEFRQSEKMPIVVVLDNIRSMHNVGSVFRTADAFLVRGVYLCGFTPQPPHRDIHKTALGATETVDWNYFPTTVSAVLALREAGYAVFAVEQTEGSVPLQEFCLWHAAQGAGESAAGSAGDGADADGVPDVAEVPDGADGAEMPDGAGLADAADPGAGMAARGLRPVAVVLGNEVEGVSEEALAVCDGAVEIPQWGMKHSLNISIAAGIVLWELVRNIKT